MLLKPMPFFNWLSLKAVGEEIRHYPRPSIDDLFIKTPIDPMHRIYKLQVIFSSCRRNVARKVSQGDFVITH